MKKFAMLSAADSGAILSEGPISWLKNAANANRVNKIKAKARAEVNATTAEKERKERSSAEDGRGANVSRTNEEYLYSFIGDLRGAPSGKDRYVLRMSIADLKDRYLKSGAGGISFVESISEEELASLEALQSRVQHLSDGYSFQKLMESKYEIAVLLDIPSNLTAELAQALKGVLDINGARSALKKMMNHRFYVMTLGASKMRKVANKVSPAWDDAEALLEVLDPTSIVVSYPNSREWSIIKSAWAARKTSSNDDDTSSSEDSDKPEEQKPGSKPEKAGPIKMDPLDGAQKADLAHRSVGQLRDELNAAGVDFNTIDSVLNALAKIKDK